MHPTPADPEPMAPHSILIVPNEEHREALLMEGACGARPPMLARGQCCGHESHRQWKPNDEFWESGSCYMCGDPQQALLLRRDGKPCPFGIARLADVACPDQPDRERQVRDDLASGSGLNRYRRLGRLVYLDAQP